MENLRPGESMALGRRCAALVLSGPTIDPHARTAARQIARGLRDLLREDPLQVPILARDVLDAGPARVWATLRAALRDPSATNLSRLAVPTLVLRGALEPIVPAPWAREATALIPGAVLVELPGAPHNAVYVTAEALVAEVRRFLSRLGPESRDTLGRGDAPIAVEATAPVRMERCSAAE